MEVGATVPGKESGKAGCPYWRHVTGAQDEALLFEALRGTEELDGRGDIDLHFPSGCKTGEVQMSNDGLLALLESLR
jgi:hypothetical protein